MNLAKKLFLAGIASVLLSVVLPAILPMTTKGADKLTDLGNTLISIAAGMSLPATPMFKRRSEGEGEELL